MYPEVFFKMNEIIAKGFYDTVVTGLLQFYESMLENAKIEKRTTGKEKEMMLLYSCLSDNEKAVLLFFMRQIIIDILSYVFGIIDGPCTFSIPNTEFKLFINGEDSNMEMQDSFLAYIEEL